jgi:hypothetical protein
MSGKSERPESSYQKSPFDRIDSLCQYIDGTTNYADRIRIFSDFEDFFGFGPHRLLTKDHSVVH